MAKSRWNEMTLEQRRQHRDREKVRREGRREAAKVKRAEKRANMTEEEALLLKKQTAAERKKRLERDPDYYANAATEYRRDGRGFFVSWVSALKSRAKERGVPFDLDADYLMSIYTDTCPVFGVAFGKKEDRKCGAANSPTVDRIVPSKGYVKGNVIIVSRRANTIKNDATVYEILQVAEFYASLAVPDLLQRPEQ